MEMLRRRNGERFTRPYVRSPSLKGGPPHDMQRYEG